MPVVRNIQVFPIKALDPREVSEIQILGSGALAFDRRWAFVDARGKFVNGKSRVEVHSIRAEYDLGRLEVALDGRVYSLERQKHELERCVSERLSERVELRENAELGFPDDTAASGPTFVSRESLALVASWFDLSLQEVRLRFRTNVEFDGVEAFWEDRLYGFGFEVGDVHVSAINPCKRCVVPSRDPRTGQAAAGFQKRFTELRRASLPSMAPPALFDHHYRFGVNTRIAPSERGRTIRTGDEVSLGSPRG